MRRYGGVFAARDALAAGVDRAHIGPLLRSGTWRRIRYGVYTTGEVWRQHEALGTTHHLECAGVLRRLERVESVISHTSAARLHDLVIPNTADADVWLTDPARFRTGRGYRVREATLPPGDVVDLDSLRVTALPRTLADVGRDWKLVDTVIAADDALADGRLTPDELTAAALAQTHWVNCGGAARAFSLARVGAHSPHETRTRLALAAAGLPEPMLQCAVHLGRRLVAILDMAWPDHGVFAECDGRIKYSDPWHGRTPADVGWAEKRRHDELLDLDLRGLRITPENVRDGLGAKVARLHELFSRPAPLNPRYRLSQWNGGLRTPFLAAAS